MLLRFELNTFSILLWEFTESNKKIFATYYIIGDGMLINIMLAIFFIGLYFTLFCIIEHIDKKFRFCGPIIHKNLVNIFLVKNMENSIEYFIRQLTKSKIEGFTNQQKIVIIDMDSSDRTWNILNRIAKDKEEIIILKFEEKDKIFHEYIV